MNSTISKHRQITSGKWGIMNTAAKLAFLLSPLLYAAFFPRSVEAQTPLTTGTGPSVEAHVGFAYLQQPIPTSSRIPMYGLDSGATVDVSRHFGVRLDLGYVRASDVLSSGHHSDILSYLGGPVFYPFTTRHVQTYVQFLAGGARVTGATPNNQGQFITGYANEFAWAGGCGLEVRTSPSSAVRVGADYLHTSYFDPNAALQGQGNLRAVVSFVYFLGRDSRRGY